MNDPPEFEARLTGDVVTIVVPTSTIRADDGEKAFPIICTVDPVGPDVGLSMIAGAVMANVALLVLPRVSVTATTLPVAAAVIGTEKLVETFPPVVVVPAAVAINAPLTVTLKTVPAGPKPVPATATVEPLNAPPTGRVKVSDVVMVNVVVADLGPSLTSSV